MHHIIQKTILSPIILLLLAVGSFLAIATSSVNAEPVDDTYQYVCTDSGHTCPKGLSQLVIKSSSSTVYKYLADSAYEFLASNGDSIVVTKDSPDSGIYNDSHNFINFLANMSDSDLFDKALATSPALSKRGSFAVELTVKFPKKDSKLSIGDASAIANVNGDLGTNTNSTSLDPKPNTLTKTTISYSTGILNNVVQGRTYKVCIRAPYINGNEQVCKNVKAPTAGKRKTVSFTVDGSLKDLETSSDTTDTLDDGTDPALGSTVACTKDNCPLISKYVNPAIAVLSALVGIVAVIAIVVGGIQVTTSAGDPQKSAAGKNHIRNAVIGVAAYVFLYAFLQWIIPGGSI